MDKGSIIQLVKEWANKQIISKKELNEAYDSGCALKGKDALQKSVGVPGVLYYIGALVILLGIGIFVYQQWNTLNTLTKIMATFGSGVAAYTIGVLFSRYDSFKAVAQAFHLIAAAIMPIGLFIIFDSAGYRSSLLGVQTVIALILFISYLSSYLIYRKNIFILAVIIFGTWFFVDITRYMVLDSIVEKDKFYEYLILTVGLTYMVLGYAFAENEKKALTAPLYGFGSLFFLGAALSLGGWYPSQNFIWELLFPGLVMGIIILSVYVKSKAFLIFGALYLMTYIFKISAEYFKNSLGWPLSLVVAGLAIMAVGYSAFRINKKYLA